MDPATHIFPKYTYRNRDHEDPQVCLIQILLAHNIYDRFQQISTKHKIGILVSYNQVVANLCANLIPAPPPQTGGEASQLLQHAVPEQLRKDQSVLNILTTLETAPWVFNKHVQILTAVSATGAQFLEVIYLKSGFTQFSEESQRCRFNKIKIPNLHYLRSRTLPWTYS